jgi:hypothetical protein
LGAGGAGRALFRFLVCEGLRYASFYTKKTVRIDLQSVVAKDGIELADWAIKNPPYIDGFFYEEIERMGFIPLGTGTG